MVPNIIAGGIIILFFPAFLVRSHKLIFAVWKFAKVTIIAFMYKCNGMVGKNRTTSLPKSILRCVLEKGHLLQSGILFVPLLAPK